MERGERKNPAVVVKKELPRKHRLIWWTPRFRTARIFPPPREFAREDEPSEREETDY